ncbi:pimeloyl-ACP methyl ester carboxylesterase [Rhizobium subbaraonis]|uniref:Pimeloyl-ACP methyl ester carboxylesterase n=2 Tax=Rhizobium subbaraonis TaxID=908946 RepID=A0A285UX61_9HYPH|nr:pimeloyl-ACP methyl ester carboxylesterase [Rhizobium subbaraonis]
MGGSVGYRTMGDGDWLVLIHGWCGNADIWSPIVPALAGGYRILAVTLPGFGGMAPPPKDGQTMGAMGAAVAHVLAHLGIDRAVLVGHSMGGPVMTEAAICAPERIRALVGLDTLTDRHYYGRVPDAEIARRHAEFAADYTGRMRGMIDDIVHPGTPETLRQSITDDMVMAAPMEFALDIKDWLLAWNAEERWPLVNCPALMLNSTWSARRAHPESMACFAATAVVPYDSGHFPMIEAPGMIVEKLKTCLAGLVCRHARD